MIYNDHVPALFIFGDLTIMVLLVVHLADYFLETAKTGIAIRRASTSLSCGSSSTCL